MQNTDSFMAALASTDVLEVLRPKSTGERVNAYVINSVEEPKPDYIAMQRLLGASKLPTEPTSNDREAKV